MLPMNRHGLSFKYNQLQIELQTWKLILYYYNSLKGDFDKERILIILKLSASYLHSYAVRKLRNVTSSKQLIVERNTETSCSQ